MNKNTIRYTLKKQKLFDLIKSLSRNKPCFATTEYLAKTIGISKRQAYRYLKDLRSEGKLYSYSNRYRESDKYGRVKFYEKRIMSDKRNHIPKKEEKLDIVFKRNNIVYYSDYSLYCNRIVNSYIYRRENRWNIEKLNQ